MNQLSIEICNNREEADARKDIIKAGNPTANWMTRVVENIDVVRAFLVPDIAHDPVPLPTVFSPETGNPAAPAVILVIWTED